MMRLLNLIKSSYYQAEKRFFTFFIPCLPPASPSAGFLACKKPAHCSNGIEYYLISISYMVPGASQWTKRPWYLSATKDINMISPHRAGGFTMHRLFNRLSTWRTTPATWNVGFVAFMHITRKNYLEKADGTPPSTQYLHPLKWHPCIVDLDQKRSQSSDDDWKQEK